MTDETEFTRKKVDARAAAQILAFGPLIFQAARVLRDKGILRFLLEAREGATEEHVAEETSVSLYAARVLLEAGLVAGLVDAEAGRYRITLLGRLVLRDRMTRVNMDFVHDVCFKPAFHLEQALDEGRPAGLHELGGEWSTIYEGLRGCSEDVRRSWFAFDHYYSDSAFPQALDIVLRDEPRRVLDVGGNTGRFAVECCTRSPDVEVVILDLPGQLEDARRAVQKAGLSRRISMHEADLLDPSVPIPERFDTIWMSQFLDCFSEVGIPARPGQGFRPDLGKDSGLTWARIPDTWARIPDTWARIPDTWARIPDTWARIPEHLGKDSGPTWARIPEHLGSIA